MSQKAKFVRSTITGTMKTVNPITGNYRMALWLSCGHKIYRGISQPIPKRQVQCNVCTEREFEQETV